MLTATYTFVAISAEQKNTRGILSQFRCYIDDCLRRMQKLDSATVQATLNQLTQFDQYCHARKLELYLIPSIRGTAKEIDALLAELELMSTRAVEMLRSVQEKLRHAVDGGIDRMRELYGAMENYCDSLLTRLAKEDEELLPLLRRLLPVDEWFPIAAKFLSDEQNPHRRHHAMQPRVPVLR